LVNGNYYISTEITKLYIFINLIFKSPEYFLFAYILFIFFYFFSKNFFKKQYNFFEYKLSLLIIILIYPSIILFFIPYPIYDGMRLFLWTLPYFCIIPGVVIYYCINNLQLFKIKITFIVLCICCIYFLINFLKITPYQYTYLNIFNGNQETRFKKFENDYWGVTLKELVDKSDLKFNKTINISTCGISPQILKYYFKKKRFYNYKFVHPKDAHYVVMTNRVTENGNPINCFDKFQGVDISKVERNNLILSVFRKLK